MEVLGFTLSFLVCVESNIHKSVYRRFNSNIKLKFIFLYGLEGKTCKILISYVQVSQILSVLAIATAGSELYSVLNNYSL